MKYYWTRRQSQDWAPYCGVTYWSREQQPLHSSSAREQRTTLPFPVKHGAAPQALERSSQKRPFGWVMPFTLFLVAIAALGVWLMDGLRDEEKKTVRLGSTPIRGLPEDEVPENRPDASIQNALTIDIVPVDTMWDKVPAKSSFKELKRLVNLQGQVFRAGPATDLRLTVHNRSSVFLEQVTIKLQYKDADGKAQKTENYTIHKLSPNSRKFVDVLLKHKDHKVNFEIISIQSMDQGPVLVFA